MLRPPMGFISTEMYEALLLAQVPEDKAKAAAAEVAKTQDFASKSDVRELQAEMDKRLAGVGKSLAVLKFAVFSGGIDHARPSAQAGLLSIGNYLGTQRPVGRRGLAIGVLRTHCMQRRSWQTKQRAPAAEVAMQDRQA